MDPAKATADEIETFSPEFLEQERTALGDDRFKREYLGIPSGGHVSPFNWAMYDRATRIDHPVSATRCGVRAAPAGACRAHGQPVQKS